MQNSFVYMLCSQQVENYSIVICLFRGLNYNISYQEIDKYFLSDCAFFQIATDVYTDLRYNEEEWD